MAEGAEEYHLRCELRGHEEDVRAVCTRENDIITASRDKTLMIWTEDNSSAGLRDYKQTLSLIGHSGYVSAAAWMPPALSPRYPKGALVSGSRDNNVVIWDLETGSPAQVLEGHGYQVTAVAVGEHGSIVSSSLDKSVRVWAPSGEATVLQGHEGPVLCVIVLSTGEILSGSGDTTVRRWAGGKCTQTVKAHGDTVRGLAEYPGIGFVTASHDQTLKVWTNQGDTLAELVGHTALVYAVKVVNEGLIVSGSEDRTCRLWRPDGTCVQTIEHPSCVWALSVLPSGDFITACGDHQAYVWSSSVERKASEDIVSVFQGSLPASKAQASGSGGEGGLPPGLTMEPPEVLMQPGQPGQTKVISENGVGMAYNWDAASGQWEKIGQVVGDPGDNDSSNMSVGSKFYNGQMWDFVFDVDVADGMPPLKMALNKEENPYMVADRFIAQYGLPETYKDQIVQFILQNTGGDVALMGMNSIPDPFTGSGAYVPGGSGPTPMDVSGAFSSATGGGVDPFTGGANVASPSLQHCPLQAYVTWTTKLSNPSATAGRIRHLSASQQSSCSIDAGELSEGKALDSLLSKAAAGTAFADADAELLVQLLSWQTDALYPAMDLARLMVLSPVGSATLCKDAGTVQSREGGQLGAAVARALAGPPGHAASQQTCLKLLSNCCSQKASRSWVVSEVSSLLDAAAHCLSAEKANVQLAHMTFLMNLALVIKTEIKDSSHRLEVSTHALTGVLEALVSGTGDELLFRALVAAGTLLHGNHGLQSLASELGIVDAIVATRSRAEHPKVAEAARDVEAILSKGL